MKKLIPFYGLLIFGFLVLNGNAQSLSSPSDSVEVYKISTTSNGNYEHIHFPRKNIIIKKGGVPNYKKVAGQKVKVKSIKEKKDGTRVGTLELVSGKRFFGSHKYIDVNLDEAIKNQELIEVN